MAIIIWIPPLKENNIIIKNGYFQKLVVPTSNFNQRNLSDVFKGQPLNERTNIVETGYITNPVIDDPDQQKTMSLSALSTKVLRADGDVPIVPLEYAAANSIMRKIKIITINRLNEKKVSFHFYIIYN
jgi:hypothetical protein